MLIYLTYADKNSRKRRKGDWDVTIFEKYNGWGFSKFDKTYKLK